jgi:NAD/NADP transhydrogenase alpha subunit
MVLPWLSSASLLMTWTAVWLKVPPPRALVVVIGVAAAVVAVAIANIGGFSTKRV